MAYGEGEAPADVVAHVEGCSTCAQAVVSDARAEAALRRSLYRFDCPDAHTLGEYQLDVLQPELRLQIAAHASGCDECRDELRVLRRFLAQPMPVSESLVRRLRRVVATLLTPSSGPAYAGLRGAAASGVRVYAADDVTVTLSTSGSGGELLGLVVAATTPPEALLDGAVRLSQAAAVGTGRSASLDELGNFEFADLESGEYMLEIDLPDRQIVVEALRID